MTISAALSDLVARLPGRVGRPGTAIYDAARHVFAVVARNRRPIAAVRPANRDEVATVLGWSADHGVPVSPRSGGHSFDGFSIQENTVILDLGALRQVTLDKDGHLRAMCGATNIDVAGAIGSRSDAVALGDCPTVGLGGLIAGGGFGYCSRRLGLTGDTLEEATLIRPDGAIVRVTETENPDLFWACRGGGGSVGVVTDMVLRTQLVPLMTSVTLTWRWDRVREAFALYADCFRKAPDTLDLKLKIRTTGADRFFDTASSGPPDAEPGTPLVHIDGDYLGSREEALDQLRPFLSDSGLVHTDIRTRSFHDAEVALIPLGILSDPAPKTLRPCRVASDFVSDYPKGPTAEAIIQYVEHLQSAPHLKGGAILIEPAGGQITTPNCPSAFAHRDATLLLQWELFHDLPLDPGMATRLDGLLEEVRDGLSEILTGGRYVNYADKLDTPGHWWGDNLGRLQGIVSEFNPRGLLISRLTPPNHDG